MQRYQVVQVKTGYAVQDTVTYRIVVTYTDKAKAISVAAKLNS